MMTTLKRTNKNDLIPLGEFFKRMGEIGVQLPYNTKFSLQPYINVLQNQNADTSNKIVADILSQLSAAEANITKNGAESCSLMGSNSFNFLLPPLFFQDKMTFIAAPFSSKVTKATKSLTEFLSDENWLIRGMDDIGNISEKLTTLGSLILKKHYGFEAEIGYESQYEFHHKETGLIKFKEIKVNLDFVEVIPTKPLLPISEDEMRELLESMDNIDLWLERLPPDRFEFRGFSIGDFHDVTKLNILSLMRDEIVNIGDNKNPHEQRQRIQSLFQAYLADNSIQIGFLNVFFADYLKAAGIVMSLTEESELSNVARPHVEEGLCMYSDATFKKKIRIHDDLGSKEIKAPAEKNLIKKGIKSIALIPLLDEEERVISVFEIGSSKKYGVNTLVLEQLKDMISLMRLLVINFANELEKQISIIIRDQFTNIHSSVEWKFREVATKFQFHQVNNPEETIIDEIKFEDVYPLYGQADVVGSSSMRVKVLKEDLITNISALLVLIETWLEEKKLFLLSSHKIKLEEILENLSNRFDSSDETYILDLLHNEIHPFLSEIKDRYSSLPTEPYDAYISILDPNLNIVYNKRRLFDDSITSMNNALMEFFNNADREMQKTLPHFYEKYKTDGLEYNIYLGQSLLENEVFTENDLKEFRLWQLKMMIDVTKLVKTLSPTLPIPIETAQLIFVYNNNLTIKFRMEEKKFDVDGAYNVRYEILKKRLDKATIKGTNERLTVSDKIAIVYLHEKEKREYMEYLRFLQHENLVEDNIEVLELNKLQGADGLKAIRFSVVF